MTDVTMTTETTATPPPAASGDYPLSTLCLRLDLDGVGVSWTLRGDDADVASRLPRILDYIKRLQAKLPKPEAVPRPEPSAPLEEMPRPTAVLPRETHECEWHGPMRESTKAPGTWYCPKRMASGEFCKEKWPKKAGERAS
jgi:hypothetical protein